ncbi:hypothetical protein HK100_004238 [Physocladia obscura]|uniref:DUF155 domain-containing protein n=1 Tax=Physocladia obscura TaxID=109957 RepID=A0AAD5XD42_9FUNG|nr:hypothetical protein HK100_004238 [Physocladia obscura]
MLRVCGQIRAASQRGMSIMPSTKITANSPIASNSLLVTLIGRSAQNSPRSRKSLFSSTTFLADSLTVSSYRSLHTGVSKTKKKGVRAVQVVQSDPDPDAIRLQVQRATAFSTAESFNFANLLPILQRQYILMPYVADDVYHVRIQSTNADSVSAFEEEAFFFSNGVLVTWGVSDDNIEELLKISNAVGEELYSELEVEWYDYVVDPENKGGIQNDTIVIGSDLPTDQFKLAYSSGLARSAKLASLENLLESHLDKNKDIPEFLQQGKKLPIGRHTILKNIGELFLLRGNVNLHSELLDLPDFCWSSPKMEDAFSDISRNLDVRARIAIFNKKLDYANELADLLRSHLHEQHSVNLELVVIALIFIAVIFETVNYIDGVQEREKILRRKKALKERQKLSL